MKYYQVYLKGREEPLTFEADKHGDRDDATLFHKGDELVAKVQSDQIAAFQIIIQE